MNSKPGMRRERLEETIKNEVNRYFRSELANPKFQFVSITKVILTSDFSYGKIYWDTFRSDLRGDLKKTLEHTIGKIKNKLAKDLKIRKIPSLEFVYDSQFESEQRITELLEEDANRPSDDSSDL